MKKVFTIIIILFSFFLVTSCKKDKSDNDDIKDNNKPTVTNKAKDEYIQVYTKVIENRIPPKEEEYDTRKESSQYGIYTQIVQLTDKEVFDIELYVKVETESGEVIEYEETKDSSTIYKGKPNTNSSYFKTSPSSFKKQNNFLFSSNSYRKIDNSPKKVFYNIYYYVKLENDNTVKKQLKYYFYPINPNEEKFDKYKNIYTLEENVSSIVKLDGELNDYLKITLKYILGYPSDNIEIRLDANESTFVSQGKYVVNSDIALFAKGNNHITDNENYFSDYILISENSGVLVDKGNLFIKDNVKNSLTNTYLRNTNIANEYEISELYLRIKVTLNTGEVLNDKIKLNLVR